MRTTFGADVNLVDLELSDLDHWSQPDSDVPQPEDGSAEVATKNGVVLLPMSDGFDGLGCEGAEKVVADLQLGSVAGTRNSDAGDRDSFY